MKSVKEPLRGKMWDKTNDQLLNQVSFSLWNELDEQIPHGLPYELYTTITDHFNEELKNEHNNLDRENVFCCILSCSAMCCLYVWGDPMGMCRNG